MKAGRFFSYLLARLKCCVRLVPSVLCLAAFLLGALALFGFAVASDRGEDASFQRIPIGVVGDVGNDTWLRLGFYALENLDSSRFSLSFETTETEKDAVQGLRSGRLSAYVVIPEGFIEALAMGTETPPIRYVSTQGASGIGTLLTDEIVGAVSRLLSETENAIYGAQDYLMDHAPWTDAYAAGAQLTEEYLSLVLDRDSLFTVETVGVSGGLGFFDYYLCAVTVLFLLLWGVACGPVCVRRDTELGRMLRASGFGAGQQVLAEYLAYMALEFAGLALLLAACRAASGLLPGLTSLSGPEPEALLRYPARAFFPALMLGAGQLLLFELSSGTVSALLLQFLAAVSMAYVSGCFYPSGFFPEAMRRAGACLPSGVAFAWLAAPGPLCFLWTALYLAAFLSLLTLLRRRNLERSVA